MRMITINFVRGWSAMTIDFALKYWYVRACAILPCPTLDKVTWNPIHYSRDPN